MSKFPSKFLKGDDVTDGEIVTIKLVRDELVGVEQDSKPILFLEEYDRGIVLNKTNAKAIVKAYGDDETTWPGKKLILFTELVRFKGEETNAIRMTAASAPKHKKEAATRAAAALDDEIPY
jgi:hypothetical protein